jgi:glutamine amidotransferase
MIGIVDYGLGNRLAFLNIYKRLNIEAALVSTVDELKMADRLILPGVGAFDWAMTRLAAAGLRAALDWLVLEERRPVLGICVGMQMMANSSEEGVMAGLGWIDAVVKRFEASRGGVVVRLPHMGWNDVRPEPGHALFRGLGSPEFYFLHSYHVVPARPTDTIGTTDYHGEFSSAIASGNIMGTQFHPEKSHEFGIELLRNFAEG